MRFIENGPSIPDELLFARDEGKVVFFCGAGVSFAKARLPNFFGLTEAVLRELRLPEDAEPNKLLAKIRDLGDGLIAADRVFGLLERSFDDSAIEAAVARSLRPTDDVDLSAHRVLLRLATTPESRIQLITTNFDRLFDRCESQSANSQPAKLPRLADFEELNGVIYLHGRVNPDYSGADEAGFVLSSSSFGHAYLAEGWATEFFRQLINNYLVVFVGYSADDPPISYLLEGLGRTQTSPHRIYTFQAGSSEETSARWQQRGVEAISYDEADGHSALWQTLEHWAERADDPAGWRQSVVQRSISGPAELKSFQRGQVAHVISTTAGAKEFLRHSPPATWLSVFDPKCRFETPTNPVWNDPEDELFDPFNLYGLDFDPIPELFHPANPYKRRDIPRDAWDGLAEYKLKTVVGDDSPTRLNNSRFIQPLSERLGYLSSWIAGTINHEATSLWALKQQSLHPLLRWKIEQALKSSDFSSEPILRTVWRYLLEVWSKREEIGSVHDDWFDLKSRIETEGWSSQNLREFIAMSCPRIVSEPPLSLRRAFREAGETHNIHDFIRLNVEWIFLPDVPNIPEESLPQLVREIRKNMELAVQLCEEVNSYQLDHLSPIIEDDRPGVGRYQRNEGISGNVLWYASLYERLIESDLSAARCEFLSWPTNDDAVFSRLRIWVAGKPEITSPDDSAQIILGLSPEGFWNRSHQRDLLLVLKKRWNNFAEKTRKEIQDRIRIGRESWSGEVESEYREHRAWTILQRLYWLFRQDCQLTFEIETTLDDLRAAAPNWKPEFADNAADSIEGQSGFVTTRYDHSELLNTPIDEILSVASAISGRTEFNRLEERDPFSGLCSEKPRRAYLALVRAARCGEYPEWAWVTFLTNSTREHDGHRLSFAISERFFKMPQNVLVRFISHTTLWLRRRSKFLIENCNESFDRLVNKLIGLLESSPDVCASGVGRSFPERDWFNEGKNSPAGRITEAVLGVVLGKDANSTELERLANLDRLLSTPGDSRKYVLAVVSKDLFNLWDRYPDWTAENLLSVLDQEINEEQEAIWAGFFIHLRINRELFMRLKPRILDLVKIAKRDDRSLRGETLARLILQGWLTNSEHERVVTHAELKQSLLDGDDDFRTRILWLIHHAEDGDWNAAREWVLPFFHNVWPLERVVKNSKMTERLFDLLISDEERFLDLVDVVTPFLSQLSEGSSIWLRFEGNSAGILRNHTERLLKLLYKVLPDNASGWPYGTTNVLKSIVEIDENLRLDSMWRKLDQKRILQ